MSLASLGIADVRAALPSWAQNIVLAGYRGSESHGTSLFEGDMATDDVDVFAICAQPTEWYLTLPGYTNGSRQSTNTNGERLDLEVHDVRKFFHLLAKGNPNVHVYLWLKAEHYLWKTIPGGWIILNRRIFLSRHCLDALAGYAMAQFKKMEGGQKYEGYMGAKRKLQVDRFGYDVKNAAHCLRLLYMGIELCERGTLEAWRPDAERELLMSVKRGERSLKDVNQMADNLWRTYYDMKHKADLPPDADYAAINSLLSDVIRSANAPRLEEGAA